MAPKPTSFIVSLLETGTNITFKKGAKTYSLPGSK